MHQKCGSPRFSDAAVVRVLCFVALFFTMFPTQKDDCVTGVQFQKYLVFWRIANHQDILFLTDVPSKLPQSLSADLEEEHRVVAVTKRSRHLEDTVGELRTKGRWLS